MNKNRKALPKPDEVKEEERRFYFQLGVDISKLREERNYSQRKVADQLFISPNTVSLIEVGEARLKAFQLKKLCESLGSTPDKLLRYGCLENTEIESTESRIQAKIASLTMEEKERLLRIMDLIFL